MPGPLPGARNCPLQAAGREHTSLFGVHSCSQTGPAFLGFWQGYGLGWHGTCSPCADFRMVGALPAPHLDGEGS